MRTVPNDKHQTAAMVQFIKHHGWNWVGMVISDGDYGRSALEHFADQAAKSGICLAFKSILPSTGTDEDLRSAFRTAVQTIYQHPKAQVIVSFSKWSHMKDIYQEMRNEVLRKGESMESMRRVWLGRVSFCLFSLFLRVGCSCGTRWNEKCLWWVLGLFLVGCCNHFF